MVPYGCQNIRREDVDVVLAALRSDFLAQGSQAPSLEQEIAAHVEAGHAVAVNSATLALHIACLAQGLGPGDWLWSPEITFVALATYALYCGARVDFAGIDPETFNMCPGALEAKLARAEAEGRSPEVVAPAAMCGQSCDMRALQALADRFGFRVLEGALRAISGPYAGHFVGDGRHSEGDFLKAKAYYARAISILLYASMTDQQQDAVVATLKAELGS